MSFIPEEFTGEPTRVHTISRKVPVVPLRPAFIGEGARLGGVRTGRSEGPRKPLKPLKYKIKPSFKKSGAKRPLPPIPSKRMALPEAIGEGIILEDEPKSLKKRRVVVEVPEPSKPKSSKAKGKAEELAKAKKKKPKLFPLEPGEAPKPKKKSKSKVPAKKKSPLWSQPATHVRVPPEGKKKKTHSTQPQIGVIGSTYGVQGTKVVKKIGNEPESIKPLRDATKAQLKTRQKGGEEKYKNWSLTDFYANGYARIPWAKIESVKGRALKEKVVPVKQSKLKTPQAYWDAKRNIPWKSLYPNMDEDKLKKKIKKFRSEHPKQK